MRRGNTTQASLVSGRETLAQTEEEWGGRKKGSGWEDEEKWRGIKEESKSSDDRKGK